MAVDNRCAVVQGRFGEENPFNELRGDFRFNRNAALNHLLRQATAREHKQRPYVVFGHILQRLDDVGDTTLRFRLRVHLGITALRFFRAFTHLMHVPKTLFHLYVEQNQHKRRNEQHVEKEYVAFH